jgi:hypothetical protein
VNCEGLIRKLFRLALLRAVEERNKSLNKFGRRYFLSQIALDLGLRGDDKRIVGA